MRLVNELGCHAEVWTDFFDADETTRTRLTEAVTYSLILSGQPNEAAILLQSSVQEALDTTQLGEAVRNLPREAVAAWNEWKELLEKRRQSQKEKKEQEAWEERRKQLRINAGLNANGVIEKYFPNSGQEYGFIRDLNHIHRYFRLTHVVNPNLRIDLRNFVRGRELSVSCEYYTKVDGQPGARDIRYCRTAQQMVEDAKRMAAAGEYRQAVEHLDKLVNAVDGSETSEATSLLAALRRKSGGSQ